MHKASTFGYLAQSIRGSLKSIGKSDKNYLLLAALVGVLEHAHAKLAQTQHVGHANGQEHALDGRDTEMQLSVAFSSAKQLTEFQNYLAEHAKLLDGLLIPDGIQFSAIEPGSAELPSHDANIFYTINPDGSVALMGDGALQTIAANMDEVELYAQTSVQTVTDAGAGSGLPSATYIASSSLPLGVIAGGLGALGLAAASSGSGGGTQAESVNPSAPANQAPTALALSASTVAENAAGAIIGTLTTTDPDSADTHTYTVNDARFEVVGSKLKLKDGTSLDYEAASTVNLSVTATDAGGLSKTQAFAIAVTDVADTPVTSTNNAPTALALSASTVAENAAGAIIGTLTTTDPDSADTHTYTVNDARFEVVGGKLKLKDGTSLDYEAASTVSLSVTATDAGGLSKTQVFAIAVTDVADTPVTSTNNAPTALALSASTVAENAAGAIIGALTTTDPDSADTHTYTVNDARFEVVGGKLKLKDGTSLDYEAASTVSLSVTATDAGGLSKTQAFVIAVTDAAETTTKIGTAGNDTFNHAGGLDDFIISGLAGADSIATSNGNDIIRLGEGADTVQAGAGNDIVVVVGQTSASQYTQADIDNPGGSGINLSSVITLADLNGRTVSEVQPGESIDGGTGTNRLVIYGNVDLTGVALTNITQFQVNSTVTLTAQQLNALPVTLMFGDGESNLNITNPGGTPVVVDLSGISLSDFRSLNLAAGVTLVVDQADVSSLLYLAGAGTLKASPATGTLNLAGKYTTLTVQDKDAVVDVTHGGASFVSGALFIASEAGETLTGGSNDDRLLGGDSNDILNGGGGNDILRGGKGVDEMHGGTGDDRFVIVGDLSGGGKIDSTADTDVLGFPLTTLNGKTFGEDVGGGTIRGGEGDDTLYVFGTADLSAWDIEGIEHIEMRSDVKFTKTFFEKNVIKTVSGDGRSTLRIVSDTPITLDLAALDAFKLSGIGSVELGSNVTLKVTSLDQLGGAKILTGAGKIEAKTGSLSLSGYTKTTGLKVKNADGSDTTGGEVLENAILRGKDGVYLGTNGDDYMKGTAVKDTFISGNGADVMLGDAGDDTYIIDGSGKKIVLDTAGADTLDLSKLTTGAKIDLINGGTAGATSIELGSGAGRAPIDLMILQDLSGSFNEDVPIVTALLDNLFAGVKAIHSDSRFGASAFVDKPVSPFGETGDYVYKTWQTITNDTGAVKTAFSNMQVLSGNDGPESQLESLYQVALRTIADDATATTTGDEIGYRSGSMRVVVLTTDADYHLAGDHAGVGPNDGDTVLDGTPQGTGEDYPTVAKVKEALVKANIYPIFAVTNGVEGTYEELVTQLGRGDVVSLSSDSSNLISSIQTGLTNFKLDFVENLVGTNQADTLTGNALNNRIEGGGGDDTIIGGAGNDTIIGGSGNNDVAIFSGAYDQYDFTPSGDKLTINIKTGFNLADGTDSIDSSVEYLRFSDGDKWMADLFPKKFIPGISEKYPFLTLVKFADAAYKNSSALGELANGDGWNFIDPVRKISPIDPWLEFGNAGAVVAVKGDSLVVSFRGTDDPDFSKIATKGSDTHDWIFQGDHYSNFLDKNPTDGVYDFDHGLLGAIKNYIEDESNGVKKLYVTGHSLGGAMASWYMTDDTYGGNYFKSLGVDVFGAAFEAPELLDFSLATRKLAPGVQYYRFEVSKDLVPDVVQLIENAISSIAKLALDEVLLGPAVKSIMKNLLSGGYDVSTVIKYTELFGAVVSQFIDDISGFTNTVADIDFLGESPGLQINLNTTSSALGYLGAVSDRHEISEVSSAINSLKEVSFFESLDYVSKLWNVFGDDDDTYHENDYDDVDMYDQVFVYPSTALQGVNIVADESSLKNAFIAAKDATLTVLSYTPIINEFPEYKFVKFINDLIGGGEREWLGAEKFTEDALVIGSNSNDVLIGDAVMSVVGSDDAFFPGAGDDLVYGDQRLDDDGGNDMVFYPDWDTTYYIKPYYFNREKDDSGSYSDFRLKISANGYGEDKLLGIEKIYLPLDFKGGDKLDFSGIDAKHNTGWVTIDPDDEFNYQKESSIDWGDGILNVAQDMKGVLTYSEANHEIWAYMESDTNADLIVCLPENITLGDFEAYISNGMVLL